MENEFQELKEKTKKAEAVFGPTFCFAKWYHANIYFQTGETHSCYHPPPHAIDAHEIRENPAALHNTAFKKIERRQMLKGEKPKGCQYCWNIENLGKDLISDRHIRTGSLYQNERVEEIKNNHANFDVGLEYVEVSFSNLCNFKCGYCHPKSSSRYLNEIKQFGPYVQSKNHRCDIDWFKIHDEENNPYLEAWWEWWPELIKTLRILRITGGEPLLQKSTYKMLDFLREFPNDQLELNVNSNLGSREDTILDFSRKAQALADDGKIRTFKLFSSIDTWGPQAEYIRTGLNLELFEKNVRNYLTVTRLPLTFMMTFNVFSVVSFQRVLEKILEWRSEFQYEDDSYFHRIRFDISYLKEPLQYDINILPKDEYMRYMDSHLEFMKANVDDTRKDKFSFMEYQRFLRIHEYMKNTAYDTARVMEGRKDFFNFFSEQDCRRGTNLPSTFPEMHEFWEECRMLAVGQLETVT